jgi:aerobic carbon-monoxide dehydrogenase small subunit
LETRAEVLAKIRLRVNGSDRELRVRPRESLAEALRSKLGLTGTHLSCQIGVCGACSVLFDGELARGCLILAVQAAGHDVRTVEGLSRPGGLSEVQQAMHEHHAVQCGFCTPGFVVMLEWLRANADLLDARDLGETLSSNLCRCTGYAGLVRAAEQVLGRRIDLGRDSDQRSDEGKLV